MTILNHIEDPRTPYQKLRRTQTWAIAKDAGIPFPEGAPKDVMVQLLATANVDIRPYLGLLDKGPLHGNIGRQAVKVIKKEAIVDNLPDDYDFSIMHIAKLRTLAKSRGVDLSKYKKKADIIARLKGGQ